MTKITANISIEPEVWEMARLKYPEKISSMIEDFLKGVIGVEGPDKLKDITKQLNDAEMNILVATEWKKQIEAIQEEQAREAEEYRKTAELEPEKPKCMNNCGRFLGEKVFTFGNLKICKPCYFTSSKDQIKKWIEEGR